MNSAISVKNLDHLGIIAGLIDEMGIVEQINQRLGIDSRKKVSTGVVDLKQLVLNLICVGDGDIPVMMEIASGNQSDKARFAGLLGELKQQWRFEGLCIADGALYSADNIKIMNDLQWLTRVPVSIKEASTLINEIIKLKPCTVEGYKLAESGSEYGGVPLGYRLFTRSRFYYRTSFTVAMCLWCYDYFALCLFKQYTTITYLSSRLVNCNRLSVGMSDLWTGVISL
ncbi:MAG: IS1634 family transposase [Cyanobacteria bacterium J06642_3]